MQSKSLLIAIAAFAATAGSVQAYGGSELLQKAGLTAVQISAFETAREKRQAGDMTGARDVLVEAGVDENVLHSLHRASMEARSHGRDIPHSRTHQVKGSHNLTALQRDALRAAHQANDKKTERAILDEAEIAMPGRHFGER